MKSLKQITETNSNLPKHLILANTLYQGAREKLAMNVQFETPKWGYLVCIGEGPQFPNLTDVKATEVGRYIDEHAGDIPNPIHFFRASVNPLGGVYFDLYEQCATLEYATKLAIEHGEPDIYDVATGKYIQV